MKIYVEPLAKILPKISSSSLKVFYALGLIMSYKDTIVEINYSEIQKATKLTEPTIRKALNELEQFKLISRIGLR